MLVVIPDAAGVLRDRDGQAYNKEGQRIDEHRNVIPEIAQGVDRHQLGVARHHGENRAYGRPMTLGDYNMPGLFYENRSAIRPPAFERSDLGSIWSDFRAKRDLFRRVRIRLKVESELFIEPFRSYDQKSEDMSRPARSYATVLELLDRTGHKGRARAASYSPPRSLMALPCPETRVALNLIYGKRRFYP
ncbi:unnamed protein product [Arabidopsis halleri]